MPSEEETQIDAGGWHVGGEMCEHKEDREETGGDWGCRGRVAMVEEGMGDKLEMEREVVFGKAGGEGWLERERERLGGRGWLGTEI